jgi:hypothetical protein
MVWPDIRCNDSYSSSHFCFAICLSSSD